MAGGRVTFAAPAGGPSAILAGSPAGVVNGKASATATANAITGDYTVRAAARGAPAWVIFYRVNWNFTP